MIIKRAIIEKESNVVIYNNPETSVIEIGGTVGPPGIPGTPGGDEMIEDTRSDHVIVSDTVEDFYKGFAVPGSIEADSVWRIFRRRITTTGDEVDIEDIHADNVGTYTKVWLDRLSYDYT